MRASRRALSVRDAINVATGNATFVCMAGCASQEASEAGACSHCCGIVVAKLVVVIRNKTYLPEIYHIFPGGVFLTCHTAPNVVQKIRFIRHRKWLAGEALRHSA